MSVVLVVGEAGWIQLTFTPAFVMYCTTAFTAATVEHGVAVEQDVSVSGVETTMRAPSRAAFVIF